MQAMKDKLDMPKTHHTVASMLMRTLAEYPIAIKAVQGRIKISCYLGQWQGFCGHFRVNV